MRAWILLLAIVHGPACTGTVTGPSGADDLAIGEGLDLSTGGGGGGGSGGGGSGGGGGGGGDMATGVVHDMALPPGTSCTHPPCLNVINGCPFPIWIHAANSSATLAPDNAMMATGTVRQFDVPGSWPAARVNAYYADPNLPASDPNALDKIELTVGGGSMNYNITYVDWLALPVRVQAVGPSCPKTGNFDPAVGCSVPVAKVLTGCPPGLLNGKRCLSAGAFCSNFGNQSGAFCHALDTPLQSCEMQYGSTCGVASQLGNGTPNVYGCSGYFDSQPAGCSPASTSCHLDGNKWCAALNRGMLAQPDSTNSALYYKTAPYNAYAKWVHDTCPGIYAFPYDDYPSGAGESGFRSCTADRIDVTFCPGG